MRKIRNLRKQHQILFAFLVALGIVALWRGLWGVMDVLIFPNNYFLSSIISLLAGIIILISLHMFVNEFVF